MFNPDDFLQTSVEGEMSTSIPSVDAGEYQAEIFKTPKPEVKEINGEDRVLWNLSWLVMDDAVKTKTGLEKPTVRQTLWLDVTDAGGLDLGEGKNVGLGKLRDALGQNKKGKAWNPSMLMGARATIKVTHAPNEKDPDNPYANVTAVAAAK